MKRNRYGNEYWFADAGEKIFSVEGDLDYWRFGGKEGEEGINESDLGFADPSGGPFLCSGFDTGSGTVKRIFVDNGKIMVEVN
jgi:hypothetical protein